MLGIVIVSYRSDNRTVAFVREELSKVKMPHQTVIVDNGASPEEAEALAVRLPGVKVIASENGGYARGNNVGACWLRDNVCPDWILFSNDDIRITSDRVVETLAETIEANPGIGAVGPEVVGLDGLRQSPEPYMGLWKRFVWMYFSSPFLSKERKRQVFELDYPSQAQEGFHYKLSGSFLMVEAEAFFRAGMFDENTFLYAEENILSERLGTIGKGCWFNPSVQVVHEHGSTVNEHLRNKESALMQFRSMAYYYMHYKGYSHLSSVLAEWVFRAVLLVR